MMTAELRVWSVCCLPILVLGLSACMPATHTQTVKPTAALYAQQQIPETELLDVGIEIFDVEEPDDPEEAEEEGYNPELKKAEAHYIPYHLKNTLQLTGHWGAIRVIPDDSNDVEVRVKGTIIKSNGEELTVRIDVTDAAGETWFSNVYRAEANEYSYTNVRKGHNDPYQDLYNAFSNDLVAHKQKLNLKDVVRIRDISKLKFAADVAPDAFGDYLKEENEGTFKLYRLPADGDPMMARVLRIREREYMLIDTVNDYYSRFYDEMWDPYMDWRVSYLEEADAKREMQRQARNRKLMGIAAIAAAIAYEVAGGDNSSATVSSLLVAGGVQSFSTGMQYSEDARIHADVIRELNESFGLDMAPMVVEVEGRTVRLQGSAQEQYREWRRLLREIFAAETGFSPSPVNGQSVSSPTRAVP